MTTGGGWQDQIGGTVSGIKLITSDSGIDQLPQVRLVNMTDIKKAELEKRFAVIYTGQRRLAKNLLRQVMGRYIVSDTEAISALDELKKLPFKMTERLEAGDIDEFGALLSENWQLTLKLDSGCTNRCINEIFDACDDLICGKMICGAGGGGYLQVVLKSGYTVSDLQARLYDKFGECDIKAQACRFV